MKYKYKTQPRNFQRRALKKMIGDSGRTGCGALWMPMRSGKSKDLENVIAHSQPNYVRPAGDLRIASDNSFSSSPGPSFFERLFGGSSQPQPLPPGRRRLQPQQGQSYYQR